MHALLCKTKQYEGYGMISININVVDCLISHMSRNTSMDSRRGQIIEEMAGWRSLFILKGIGVNTNNTPQQKLHFHLPIAAIGGGGAVVAELVNPSFPNRCWSLQTKFEIDACALMNQKFVVHPSHLRIPHPGPMP